AQARVPSIRPCAATNPDSSNGVSRSRVPGSNSFASRLSGLRGSSSRDGFAGLAAAAGAGCPGVATAVINRLLTRIASDAAQREHHVVPAETEGVVQHDGRTGAGLGRQGARLAAHDV